MASTVYYSITRKPTDGITTVWEFSFAGGYIDPRNVKARTITAAGIVTELPVQPADVIGTNQLRITPALPAGLTLEIYRDTPKEQPLVDFTDGAIMSEASLQRNARQAILAVAEMVDHFADTDSLAAETAAIAANAMSTSEEALLTAQNAVVKADSAISTANSAFTFSDQANSKADSAVSTANDASNKADSAVAAASSVVTIADSAVATANNAQSIADSANTKSDEALQVARGIDDKASQALDNSTTALTTANAIDGKATEALTTSEQAILQATEANALASGLDKQIQDANEASVQATQDAALAVNIANSVDGKAQLALDTAGTAVDTANEAKDSAVLAQSTAGTAVDTANEAKDSAVLAQSTAQQALDYANGAMKGANNLSDLENVSTSRDNLGLGDSATRNVGTEPDCVLAVGNAFGLGDEVRYNDNTSIGGLFTYFEDSPATLPTDYPYSYIKYGTILRIKNGFDGDGFSELAISSSAGGELLFRGSKDAIFRSVWHSGNFNPYAGATALQSVEQFTGEFPYNRLYNTPYIPRRQADNGFADVDQLAFVRSRYHNTADSRLNAGDIVSGSSLSSIDLISREWDTPSRRMLGFSNRENVLSGTWRVLNSANLHVPFTATEYGVYLAVRIS